MRPFVAALMSACALAFASAAAAAQEPAAQAQRVADEQAQAGPGEGEGTVGEEIIVEGQTEKQVREFLWRAIVPAGPTMTRRSVPICLGFDNTPAALADPLAARIKANLAELSIALAEPGCRANTLIVLHEDAHRFVNSLAKIDSGVLFGAQYLPERRRLIKPVRPIYSWHYNPEEAQRLFLAGSAGGDGGVNFASPNDFGNVLTRILTDKPPQPSSNTFTVIDMDAIDGLTIEQLGDYLTMQMLVEFRPDLGGEAPAGSILSLFTRTGSNPDAPPGLSPLDRTILDQLYNKSKDFTVRAFRAAVSQRMAAAPAAETPARPAPKP